MIKQIILGAALFAGSLSVASAGLQIPSSTNWVDFEDLAESQTGDADTMFESGGVTFTTAPGSILSIFDTNCSGAECTGGDADLGFPDEEFGLVLIVNEQNPVGSDGPDDAISGVINIDFGGVVEINELVFLDLGDPNDGTVTAFLDGTEVGLAIDLVGLGDNEAASTFLDGIIADSLVVNLESSGALASVHFTPVPVPAALPLMFSGLFGLIFGLRKAKTA